MDYNYRVQQLRCCQVCQHSEWDMDNYLVCPVHGTNSFGHEYVDNLGICNEFTEYVLPWKSNKENKNGNETL